MRRVVVVASMLTERHSFPARFFSSNIKDGRTKLYFLQKIKGQPNNSQVNCTKAKRGYTVKRQTTNKRKVTSQVNERQRKEGETEKKRETLKTSCDENHNLLLLSRRLPRSRHHSLRQTVKDTESRFPHKNNTTFTRKPKTTKREQVKKTQ